MSQIPVQPRWFIPKDAISITGAECELPLCSPERMVLERGSINAITRPDDGCARIAANVARIAVG